MSVSNVGPLPIIIGVAFLVLFIVAWVKILTKAGYNGAWVLIGFVPIVNIVMFLVFAFGRWPIENQRGGYGPPPGQYPPPGYGPPR